MRLDPFVLIRHVQNRSSISGSRVETPYSPILRIDFHRRFSDFIIRLKTTRILRKCLFNLKSLVVLLFWDNLCNPKINSRDFPQSDPHPVGSLSGQELSDFVWNLVELRTNLVPLNRNET